MATEIQFCAIDNSKYGPDIAECFRCDEGLLYYPELEASDIRDNMDTFKAMCRCTECDKHEKQHNTAPRYLRWRVVVRI